MARPATARARVAYDTGRRGEPAPDFIASDPDLLDAYDEGLADNDRAENGEQAVSPPRNRQAMPKTRKGNLRLVDSGTVGQPDAPPGSPTAAAKSPAGVSPSMPKLHLPGSSSAGTDGSGFLLGMFAYIMVINYIRGGLPQVKAWWFAKFVNKVTLGLTPQQTAGLSSALGGPLAPGTTVTGGGTGTQQEQGQVPASPSNPTGVGPAPSGGVGSVQGFLNNLTGSGSTS